MKLKPFSKGIPLAVAGIILAFFPQLISGVFHFAGGIIILISAVILVISLTSGKKDSAVRSGCIMGLVVGVLTSILPDLTSVLVPIIIGTLLAVSGLNFLTRAKVSSGRRKTVFYAVSVLLIVFALAVMLNIVDSGKTVRIIAGTAMAVTGFYNFFLERSAKSEEVPDIIDVNDFTVKDDSKYIK